MTHHDFLFGLVYVVVGCLLGCYSNYRRPTRTDADAFGMLLAYMAVWWLFLLLVGLAYLALAARDLGHKHRRRGTP